MKRTLIALLAVMFAAVGANAASFSIDSDKQDYLVGETITVTITVNVGAEVVGPFSSYGLGFAWDATKADGAATGTQNPILAGLSGSPTPTCAVSGLRCDVISQVNASFANVNVGPAVLIGTLQLLALDLGSLGFVVDSLSNLGVTDPGTVAVGSNFANAQVVVPEPTTAALLGLGLLGLGVAGRRR